MTTGMDITELDKTEDIRKTAIIDRELTRLNVDILPCKRQDLLTLVPLGKEITHSSGRGLGKMRGESMFGLGKINENGERLLEFCTSNDLCIANTFYNDKDRHKVSWCHPRSGHWHKIDFVIVRKNDVNTVKQTRSFQSADCNTDHLLVIAKVKIVTKKTPRAEKSKKPKTNTKYTQDPAIRTKFQEYVEEQLQNLDSISPDHMWNNMKSAIYGSASRAFGTDRLSKEDCIEANASILMPLLEKERKIFIKHNRKPTESTKQQLRAAKSNLQKETRKCANQYWDKLCLEIQQASDMGNIRKMYEKIGVAIGLTVSKVAPLKSATDDQLTDKKKQMERWVENYSQLYTKE
ncbi:craniofacial development protein 2-like [Octopus bimaculoides]|uniref:craniofacial development protein 2-like n=1 Tax=Octopus bimaculoides TaxID=37653 RepID=UPI00071DF7F5|nr:craniofacial development protein 2-like [Octopus bimaculoides]|eukprot:XP_014788680.1 PREDICTED: craniofacial development protein 2-like [Octopus bimaculoides]